MKVTLDVPDDLAADLRQFEGQSAAIIAAGLRELKAPGGSQFQGVAQVLEKLAELPSAEEVLQFRPSPELAARISELLEKSSRNELTTDEEAE